MAARFGPPDAIFSRMMIIRLQSQLSRKSNLSNLHGVSVLEVGVQCTIAALIVICFAENGGDLAQQTFYEGLRFTSNLYKLLLHAFSPIYGSTERWISAERASAVYFWSIDCWNVLYVALLGPTLKATISFLPLVGYGLWSAVDVIQVLFGRLLVATLLPIASTAKLLFTEAIFLFLALRPLEDELPEQHVPSASLRSKPSLLDEAFDPHKLYSQAVAFLLDNMGSYYMVQEDDNLSANSKHYVPTLLIDPEHGGSSTLPFVFGAVVGVLLTVVFLGSASGRLLEGFRCSTRHTLPSHDFEEVATKEAGRAVKQSNRRNYAPLVSGRKLEACSACISGESVPTPWEGGTPPTSMVLPASKLSAVHRVLEGMIRERFAFYGLEHGSIKYLITSSTRWSSVLQRHPTSRFELVFHGTACGNLDGIVRKGFSVNRRSKQLFGPGDYSSIDPRVSVDYCCQRKRLLVCLLIIGEEGFDTFYHQETIRRSLGANQLIPVAIVDSLPKKTLGQ